MDRFPASLFPPSGWQWRLDGAALSGGTPISGAPQSADASGGGWWVCKWSPAMVATRQQHGALRSIVGALNSGVALIEVPVIDSLQPWPTGFLPTLLPFLDGSEFIDTGEFVSDPITAQLAAQVYMQAWPNPPVAPTQAQIELITGNPLQGGEFFSVIGPSLSVRLHMVTRVLSVAGNVSTVSLVPPFREDMAAGTVIDFNEPRCTMKLDIASAKSAWAELSGGMVSRPTLTFAESGFVVPTE